MSEAQQQASTPTIPVDYVDAPYRVTIPTPIPIPVIPNDYVDAINRTPPAPLPPPPPTPTIANDYVDAINRNPPPPTPTIPPIPNDYVDAINRITPIVTPIQPITDAAQIRSEQSNDYNLQAGYQTTILKTVTKDYTANMSAFKSYVDTANTSIIDAEFIMANPSIRNQYDWSKYKSENGNGTGYKAYVADVNDMKSALKTAKADYKEYEKSYKEYADGKNKQIKTLKDYASVKAAFITAKERQAVKLQKENNIIPTEYTFTDENGKKILGSPTFTNPDKAQQYIEALNEPIVAQAQATAIDTESGKLFEKSKLYTENQVEDFLGLKYSPKGVYQIASILTGSIENAISPILNFIPGKQMYEVLAGNEGISWKNAEKLGLSPDDLAVAKLAGVTAEILSQYMVAAGVSAVGGAALGFAGSRISSLPVIGGLAEKTGAFVSNTSLSSLSSSVTELLKGYGVDTAKLIGNISLPTAKFGVAGIETVERIKALITTLSNIPLSTMIVGGVLVDSEYNKLMSLSQQKGADTAILQGLIDVGGFAGAAKGFGYGFSKGQSLSTQLDMQKMVNKTNEIIRKIDAGEITEANVLIKNAKFPGFTEQGLEPNVENFKALSVNYHPSELSLAGKTGVFSATQSGSTLKSLITKGVEGGELPLLWGAPSLSPAFLGELGGTSYMPGVPNPFTKKNILNIYLDDIVAPTIPISKMERGLLSDEYWNVYGKTGKFSGIMPSEQGLEQQIIIGAGQKFEKVGQTIYVKLNGNWMPLNSVKPIVSAETLGVADDAVINLGGGYNNSVFYMPSLTSMVSSNINISAPIGSVKISNKDASTVANMISDGSLSKIQAISAISVLSPPSFNAVLSNLSPSKLSSIISSLPPSTISNIINKSDITPSKISEIISNISPTKISDVISDISPTKISNIISSISTSDISKIVSNISDSKLSDVISNISSSKLSDITSNLSIKQISSLVNSSSPSVSSRIIDSLSEYKKSELSSYSSYSVSDTTHTPNPHKFTSPTSKFYMDKFTKKTMFKVSFNFTNNKTNSRDVEANSFRNALEVAWSKRGTNEIPTSLKVTKITNKFKRA